MHQFLNTALLTEFPTATFTEASPFPWHDFPGVLTQEGFSTLYENYPSLAMFERHAGMERPHGQRPHDRYYLAYEQSIYQHEEGEVKHSDLPPAWQAFMEELKTSDVYHRFLERLLGTAPLTARYAWHVGITGSEVSPHRDADNKIGTHIFYFNTHDDWNPAWGGSTLALGGKKIADLNPDFSDFTSESASEILDNHSFLFKNTHDAWHGVKTLTCPEDRYRRLFNVILHAPETKKRTLGDRLRGAFQRPSPM